jgi:RimJ/RimL family protein N-acetyltransferase
MITLKETNLKKAKEILDFAVKEKAFLSSIEEGEKTIYEVVEYFQNGKNFQLFEILNKNQTIGLISSFPNPKRFDETVLSIGAMYILPENRGKGIGKKALKLFLENAKKRGFKKAFTKTWSSNKASNKIFQEVGFKEESRIKNDRINGDDTIEYLLEM